MGITIIGSNPTARKAAEYYSDGTYEYRKIIRGGKFYTDKLLPGGNWNQAEGVGWVVVGMEQ